MEQDESQKRWTAKRRAALVVETLRADVSVAEAARKHGLTVAEIEDWRDCFMAGAENALRSRPLDDEAQKEREIKRLKQKVGELVMDLDILKDAVKGPLRGGRCPTSERGAAGGVHSRDLQTAWCCSLGTLSTPARHPTIRTNSC